MLLLSAEEIYELAPLSPLVDCLEAAFRSKHVAPNRQVVSLPGDATERLLLCMPAFNTHGAGVVKISTVCSDNRAKGLPTIQAVIVAFSQRGTPIAVLDGTAITRLRTAAASALASRYLSRTDSSHLVIIATGALAPVMAAAHCTQRPVSRVSVCGRNLERASETAAAIRSLVAGHIEVLVAPSTEEAVATADIVSCATSSSTAVVRGGWLRPGTLVDLVGSFSPSKREADDDTVSRSRIFVDTFEGALAEAGDILDPLARDVITRQRIEGELADLVCGRVRGRASEDEIILFKSVGTAIEDLAASQLVIEAASRRGLPGSS